MGCTATEGSINVAGNIPGTKVPSRGGIARGARKQSEYLGFDERPTNTADAGGGGGVSRNGRQQSKYQGFDATEEDEC